MVAAFTETLLKIARETGRSLSDQELRRFETHYHLLQKWSRRMNLTGLKDESMIARRHFMEPIAIADLLDDEGRLVDIGSGNGFPAVPLKVLRPGLELVLVESSEKKSAFLRAVIRELALKQARVETRRVRRLADLADLLPCRYLTLRAVRTDGLLKGAGIPILVPGGKGLFFVTPDQVERLRLHPPIKGLRLSGTRSLPSDPRSVLAILEPETP
jgi:16S rRNA (guanine527-N7)-methyltransferase